MDGHGLLLVDLGTLRTALGSHACSTPKSPTGYKLEPGPFPGWARLPEW